MPDESPQVSTGEDWGHPGRPRTVSCEAVQAALEDIDEPASASEVAESMGESNKPVRRRLEELHEDGLVERKSIHDRAIIWW